MLAFSISVELILRNRLLNAVRGVEACNLAAQKPSATVQGVIADLQSSVNTQSSALIAPNALVIDRRMKGAPAGIGNATCATN